MFPYVKSELVGRSTVHCEFSEFSYLNYYDVLDGSDVEGPNTKEEKATRKSGGKSF